MIGRDLRTIREACGVTMQEVADAWTIPVTTVHARERGEYGLSPREAEAYVGALARVLRRRGDVSVVTLSAGDVS